MISPLKTIHSNGTWNQSDLEDALTVVSKHGKPYYTIMACPCGCDYPVISPLVMGITKAKWQLTEHEDGTASLSPSIQRNTACKSHFFLRNGMIQWCGPPPDGAIR